MGNLKTEVLRSYRHNKTLTKIWSGHITAGQLDEPPSNEPNAWRPEGAVSGPAVLRSPRREAGASSVR